MAIKKCCNNSDEPNIKVESLTLDDGRRAERHVSTNEQNQEVVEIFAEEKRPLKLEKRIVREYKNVVSKEIHQTVKDGEVAYEEVHSTDQEVPLQLRSRVGIVDHNKIVDGDYVRKEEIGNLIADGVVAGMNAIMEKFEPTAKIIENQPVFKAQEVVEKSVEQNKKNDMIINLIMGVIILAQVAIFGYIFLI